MEVRTRVLRDQLGVKLAKEANANFDAGLTVRVERRRPSGARANVRARAAGRAEGGPWAGEARAGRTAAREGPRAGSNGMRQRAARL